MTICPKCLQPLRASQYGRIKREGQTAPKGTYGNVCRNYPSCGDAEKEI